MSTASSLRRSTLAAAHLLFSAVLLAFVSSAWATNITYNFVDYPASQTDLITPGTDTVSGTLITDGTLGDWSANHFIDASLTFTSPTAVSTGPYSSIGTEIIEGSGTIPLLYATPTQLLLPPMHYFSIGFSQLQPGAFPVNLTYDRGLHLFSPIQQFDKYDGVMYDHQGNKIGSYTDTSGSTAPGAINQNDPWIIATVVPEPAFLSLLASALLGLAGVVYLRRRRANA